jgi:hypothetical protein
MANWMAKESKREKSAGTKGVFKRAAEQHGESTHAFAEEKKHAGGKTGARARMALMYEKGRANR